MNKNHSIYFVLKKKDVLPNNKETLPLINGSTCSNKVLEKSIKGVVLKRLKKVSG